MPRLPDLTKGVTPPIPLQETPPSNNSARKIGGRNL